MGTGIGKYCERCGEQLNYDDGFYLRETGSEYDLCNKCDSIVKFEDKRRLN